MAAKKKARAKAATVKARPKGKSDQKSGRKSAKGPVRNAPKRRKAGMRRKSSLVQELSALAEAVSSLGRTMIEAGGEKANRMAKAGLLAIERRGERIGNELAAMKRRQKK
jgi:hypothetical protein